MNTLLLSLLATPEGGSGGLSILLFQMVAIGGVFYLLLIRPQSKARKQHQEMLTALKRGDEITTAGGIIGKVKDLKDDRITIESGDASLVVERNRIVRVGETSAPGA
ncbi:MAG: preprotein translocase subunit YajC [Gemmatimonadota bacterium]